MHNVAAAEQEQAAIRYATCVFFIDIISSIIVATKKMSMNKENHLNRDTALREKGAFMKEMF